MFKGKVFTITGAASGIGKATAIRLAELGASGLAISDVNWEAVKEVQKTCLQKGANTTAHKADVTNVEETNHWIMDTFTEFGRLDGCANVAGIATGDGNTTVGSMLQKDWDFTMAVNLTGILNCMRAQLAKITKPGGSIVNVSSTSGLFGSPGNAAYATSKFGVIGLTESAAGEYGREGIRINALLPGPIDTAIIRNGEARGLWNSQMLGDETLLGRTGYPNEVANVLCFLLSDDASYVTGAKWTVDGGYAAARTKAPLLKQFE